MNTPEQATTSVHGLNIVNPDRHLRKYLIFLGAYGWTRLLVFARTWDDAVDEAIDWCVQNAPGLLCTTEVHEEYDRLVERGVDQDEAWEQAALDTVCGGNAGDYLLSWELSIIENPTREDIQRAKRM